CRAHKEPGEPDHAGNPGGRSVWWQWTAPRSGPVIIQTEGSSFDTLLAVYTGTTLSGLTLVASSDDIEGLLVSKLAFQAEAGKEYQIVVDGYDGGCGNITLILILELPRLCLPVTVSGDDVRLCLDGEMGRDYIVDASSDLVHWTALASVHNTAGELRFRDPGAGSASQRFYRALLDW
ncbi:MAG TPA: hypothetical protein VEO53_03290, partial [Candidatus Binatia bacterium]|nr:hypothetical protein [Candidatus Binatia bacterium]